jgi:two-component system sensor histidine kinase AlgZ
MRTYEMKDSQILSAFQPPLTDLDKDRTPGAQTSPLVFDACHVGVVLRAVLFVELVVAVGTLFVSANPADWLSTMALVTGGALAATLAWLLAACSLKKLLARISPTRQYLAGALLGALAACYGAGLLGMANLIDPVPWFASACAGALLACVLVVALILRAKGRTPATTAARLADLQARIRPHFLFNTLNSAIALVRAEPAKAEALLEDLSDLFRHALADQAESTRLGEEILLARRYLAIEQVRFGGRLQIEWAIDPAADGARLPPLLLQPLVENAVRHGVEPSESGALLKVSTQRRGNRVVLKVTNTVPAGPGEVGQGLALDNVRNRLALMHDVQASFQCALTDGVYQVRLEFPAEEGA